jgi:hypothetical protein
MVIHSSKLDQKPVIGASSIAFNAGADSVLSERGTFSNYKRRMKKRSNKISRYIFAASGRRAEKDL